MAKKKAAGRKRRRATATSATSPIRFASIFPGPPPNSLAVPRHALPREFVDSVEQLEVQLGLPVWLLVQDAVEDGPIEDSFNMLGDMVARAFFSARHDDLPQQKIALLIDSPGGFARSAYELAMLLRRHCGGFTAVIPRHAKSAATLLTLGADQIIMNAHAELGPLDVQMYDPDREDRISGLDEVESLQRLHAFALRAFDRTMLMLMKRTKKKIKNLVPYVTDFVTKLTDPLYQSIDVVRYTQMSRLLNVAEKYGKRLLEQEYGSDGGDIANRLVEEYPEHGFPIYPDEVSRIGLKVSVPPAPLKQTLERITRHLPNLNAVGRII